jgi:hypothetical protein
MGDSPHRLIMKCSVLGKNSKTFLRIQKFILDMLFSEKKCFQVPKLYLHMNFLPLWGKGDEVQLGKDEEKKVGFSWSRSPARALLWPEDTTRWQHF